MDDIRYILSGKCCIFGIKKRFDNISSAKFFHNLLSVNVYEVCMVIEMDASTTETIQLVLYAIKILVFVLCSHLSCYFMHYLM